MPDPLTRVDALVAAAVMAHHERRQPAWAGIAARLTAWAHEQPQTEHEEEGEMPSQDREMSPRRDRIQARNEAAPGVQKHPRDLVASPRPTEPGGVRPMTQDTRNDTLAGGAS